MAALLVALAFLLGLADSDHGRSVLVAEPGGTPGLVTGSPIDLTTLPAGAESAAAPEPPTGEPPPAEPPPAEPPPAEPPLPALPAPATPTTRPVPAPVATRPTVAPAPPKPPTVSSYEAESSNNSLDGTRTFTCPGCSGGKKVGNIGRGMGTLQFNGVGATEGPATVTLVYVNGEDTRTAQLSVNGDLSVWLSFPGTGGWSRVGTLSVNVRLRAGGNTLRLSNSGSPAPDFDRVVVSVPVR